MTDPGVSRASVEWGAAGEYIAATLVGPAIIPRKDERKEKV